MSKYLQRIVGTFPYSVRQKLLGPVYDLVESELRPKIEKELQQKSDEDFEKLKIGLQIDRREKLRMKSLHLVADAYVDCFRNDRYSKERFTSLAVELIVEASQDHNRLVRGDFLDDIAGKAGSLGSTSERLDTRSLEIEHLLAYLGADIELIKNLRGKKGGMTMGLLEEIPPLKKFI